MFGIHPTSTLQLQGSLSSSFFHPSNGDLGSLCCSPKLCLRYKVGPLWHPQRLVKLLYFEWSPPWHFKAYILTHILTFYLTFYLTPILTFYLPFFLAFYLAWILAFYLASILAFYLAFYLASILAFSLASILAFYLTSILAFYLTFCCSGPAGNSAI